MGYFKPWRRKIGMITLVLACLSAAGWARSISVEDVFSFGGRQLRSHSGLIEEFVDTSIDLTDFFGQIRTTRVRVTYWRVPYWSIVVPLTLLSAYLLLSKPRVAKQTAEST